MKYKEKKYQPVLVKEEVLLDYRVHQEKLNKNLKGTKKDYGIFFTPEWIIDFMVDLVDTGSIIDKEIYVLEPACGLAQFLIGIKKNKPALSKKAKFFGVEINQDVINYLKSLHIPDDIRIIRDDYLLWQSDLLFNLIIGNPPYGIPSSSEHYTIKVSPPTKAKYKRQYETWYGKYNIYGAFVEKSIRLLKPGGQLIFIIPATFMILDEFKKLRKFLSQNGGTAIIYMGPDVFKPEADVSSVVINFLKSAKFAKRLELLEYANGKVKTVKIATDWQGEVVKFETKYTKNIEDMCSYSLGEIYEIRISPRTSEIKNNPCVLVNISVNGKEYLPILNGRNLASNMIIYEPLTGYWIKKTEINKLRNFFSIPHIVVGLGFRKNGNVAAAKEEKCYPWMGDVYHLLRRNNLFGFSFDMSDSDVVEYLNSDYVKKYVKDMYREITYHLSITQLKNLPLPNKKEWGKIKEKWSL
ncbi:MAG: N-6 DNA methylase [Candidatus Omnitrophica bacterium]|nr:N-6 DNA methylase [Candidatus Omnitrophota bacterium]